MFLIAFGLLLSCGYVFGCSIPATTTTYTGNDLSNRNEKVSSDEELWPVIDNTWNSMNIPSLWEANTHRGDSIYSGHVNVIDNSPTTKNDNTLSSKDDLEARKVLYYFLSKMIP